jgi:hypothetical protein
VKAGEAIWPLGTKPCFEPVWCKQTISFIAIRLQQPIFAFLNLKQNITTICVEYLAI